MVFLTDIIFHIEYFENVVIIEEVRNVIRKQSSDSKYYYKTTFHLIQTTITVVIVKIKFIRLVLPIFYKIVFGISYLRCHSYVEFIHSMFLNFKIV